MSVGVFALAVGVIAVTYVVVASRRERVARAYERGDTLRKLVTAIAIALVAWTFLRSGDPVLIGAAILGIAFATIYVVIEQPHKEVV